MISYAKRTADVLNSGHQAIVIPVNCRGVMGKGIAYRTARLFPEDEQVYVQACRSGRLQPGGILINVCRGTTIIHLAVQDDWRDRARTGWLSSCLNALAGHDPFTGTIGIAGDMCYQGLLWKDVRHIIQYSCRERREEITLYPPLIDDRGNSRLTVTGEGLTLIRHKIALNRFNTVRLQMACFMTNVFLGREHYPFSKGSEGPVSLMVRREAERVRRDMTSFHLHQSELAYDLFNRCICTKDTEHLLQTSKEPAAQGCRIVNEIEDDLVLYACGGLLYLLMHGTEADETGLVLKVRSWSDRSPFALCEPGIYQKAFQILRKEHLIETDMFGTIRYQKP